MSAKKTPNASPGRVRTNRGRRRMRNCLTFEQQAMVVRYLPFARKMAKPYKDHWPVHSREFDSIAILALIQAVESFAPERGLNLATFARIRIKGGLKDALRKFREKRWTRKLPNAPRTFHYVPGADEADTLMLVSPDPEVGHDVDAVDSVEKWLSILPPQHAEVCRQMYLKHRSQTEVAAHIGLPNSRICKIHAEALRLLRDVTSVQDAAFDLGLDCSRN